MSKSTLLVLSVLVVLMGIFKFIPAFATMVDAAWYGVVIIVIGVVSFAIAYSDKK